MNDICWIIGERRNQLSIISSSPEDLISRFKIYYFFILTDLVSDI